MASQPYIGAIFLFAGNFAPRGYMLCQGQLLSISQNAALFSILGTTYGGNGTTTFGLPDLRGRIAVGAGTGPGLSPVVEGEIGGSNSATILISNMPAHNHQINCNTTPSTTTVLSPGNSFNAAQGSSFQGGTGVANYSAGPANATMAPTAVSVAGQGIPLSIQNPFLGLNYIIATVGLFPTRN